MMNDTFLSYWYILAESRELTQKNVLARQLFGQNLACFRDVDGKATVIPDRCIHRCARLSQGKVNQGQLQCHYHGWVYGKEGKVIAIPTESDHFLQKHPLSAKSYATLEEDGYLYVCLAPKDSIVEKPFAIPRPKASEWHRVRLQNRFQQDLPNCVENYIDVPHTAYVHRGIFRKPKRQPVSARVTRQAGHVHIQYIGESMNLGSFSWLLNPTGKIIEHHDHFYAPNITSVHYLLPTGYAYFITSQSVPVTEIETLVYTDISYYFGFWTAFARGIVKRQAKKVIDQDKAILQEQAEVIHAFGERFCHVSADRIHTAIRAIYQTLKQGGNITLLPEQAFEVTFWV